MTAAAPATAAACSRPAGDSGTSPRPEYRPCAVSAVSPCRTRISRVAVAVGGAGLALPDGSLGRGPAAGARPSPRWPARRRACSARAGSTRSARPSNFCTRLAASAASGRRPACLICQRPDICSTTSLESIRTSTSSAPSSAAALRPAIRPEYSATLLVVTPSAAEPLGQHLAGRPGAHDGAVAGRAGVAPRAAVRLDDDLSQARTPPSAPGCGGTPRSRTTSSAGAPCARWRARRRTARSGSRRSGPAQQRRADAAAGLADLVVERDQVGRQVGGERARGRPAGTPRPWRSSASVSSRCCSVRSRPARVAVSRACDAVERGLRLLALLHQLELGVLQLALPAAQRGQLVLQGLQLAGRARPASSRCLVLVLAGADLLDVASRGGRCPGRGRRRRPGPGPARPPARTARGRAGRARRAPAGCVAGARAGPARCRWPAGRAGGAALPGRPSQAGLLRCGRDACSVHGSVSRSDTIVSTPASARRQAATSSSHGRSVAQCAASMQRRAAAGEVLARRMVAQVGGQVRVDAGRARRRRGTCRRRRRRPRPCGSSGPGRRPPGCRGRVGGRRAAAKRGEASARASGSGSSPIRPVPRPRPSAPDRRDQRAQVDAGRGGAASASDTPGGGDVGVGVRDEQRDVGPDQLVHDPALVRRRRDRRTRRAAAADGARRSGRRRPRRASATVSGTQSTTQQHRGDRRVGIAEHETDAVPVLRPGRRIAPVEQPRPRPATVHGASATRHGRRLYGDGGVSGSTRLLVDDRC